MHCHFVDTISRTSIRIFILVGSGYAGLGIAGNLGWTGNSRKRVEETTGTRPDLPASLIAALADLDRWALLNPDWKPLRLRVATVLKAAFATGGSPVTSLEPADDQTAFLIERIREGWGEGVPAVRVVTPALDRNRLLARVKAIDDCADRDHPAAQRFHNVLASEPERIADWAGIMLVDGGQSILPSLQQFDVEPNYYPGNKEGHIPTRSASEGPMKSSESRRGSPWDD